MSTPLFTYDELSRFVGERSVRKFVWSGAMVAVYSKGGVVSVWTKSNMIATLSKNKVRLSVEFDKDSPAYLKELAMQVLSDN